MGENGEHSEGTKLGNSRQHIWIQLVKSLGSLGIYIYLILDLIEPSGS